MDGGDLSTQSEDKQPAENQPKQTGEQQPEEQQPAENQKPKNTEIHLTRRQAILYPALGLAGVLVGKRILTWIGNSLQSFKPQFNVHINSDKEIKSSNLSETKRALITASNRYERTDGRLNGYIEIDFTTEKGLAIARIYKGFDLLAANVYQKGTKPIIPREVNCSTFTFVAQGPGLAEKVVKTRPDFLKNEELLARVLEGEKLNSDWEKRHEAFSTFWIYSGYRDYHTFRIPTECKLQLKKDNVLYTIEGLEALTDGDENLFAEFWIRRKDFEDYKTFKEQYDTFARIRKEFGDSVSAEQAAKKLHSLAATYSQQRDSSDFTKFMEHYVLFSEAARRVEESRRQEK